MKKTVQYLFLTVIILSSCSIKNDQDDRIIKRPVNYIILLDLSDRLLVAGQDERDIHIIQTIYNEFTIKVRRNLVINSEERFQVLIAPQKRTHYNPANYQNKLYLDMRSINPALKLNSIENFGNELKTVLEGLYTEARQGEKNEDYNGSDIWRFFNESLSYLIDSKYDNYLVILTDGYFDFEDYSHQLPEGNRYPTSCFLKDVRSHVNWNQILEEKDLGLIPVKKDFHGLMVCVAEVNPKHDFQYESDLLEYIWKKWCGEMKISDFTFIQRTGLPQTKNLVSEAINKHYEVISLNK